MNGLRELPRRRMRGSMLIVAMGILALMSIMAITFARLMKLESDASNNYIDMIRAKLCAESGYERAKISLRESMTGRPIDEVHDSVSDSWVYKDKSGNLAYGTLVEDSDNPSYEGPLGGTYKDKGNIYKVKVMDCASQLNLNGRQPRLAEMLDTLGRSIAKVKGVADPVATLDYKGNKGGAAIVSFKGTLLAGSFSSKTQLLELYQESERAKGTENADQVGLDLYNSVKDYITANSWLNENSLTGSIAPGATSVPSGYGCEKRAPVNINTAPKEVIMACMEGLGGRGRYVGIRTTKKKIDADSEYASTSGEEEEVSLSEIIEFVYVEPLTFDQAEQIADLIMSRRNTLPFRSYVDFEYFVDTVVPDGALPPYKPSLHDADDRDIDHFKAWYKRAARDMLKANFNPNARPNFFNPNVAARLIVDKANLIYPSDKTNRYAHSTEFCFSSMGYFEIISLGQILDPKDEVVAESKVRTVVKIFETITHSTQKEFELAEDADKEGILTYPLNIEAFNGDGDERVGYIEMEPADEKFPDSADLYKQLDVPFDPENYNVGDPDIKIAESLPGSALQPAPDTNNAFEYGPEPKDSDVLPDGFFVTKFKGDPVTKMKLSYRAAAATAGGLSTKDNAPAGTTNIPMHEGALEFWVKPQFDSTEKVFSAYLGVTTYTERQAPPKDADDQGRTYKGGTQMFFFKNTDGTLRVTRLYYEGFFADSSGNVSPTDFDPKNPDCYPPYPEDKPYKPKPTHPDFDTGRPLPGPDPDTGDNLKCMYPRLDIIIDHDTWGGWKAGEWHHVMITFNDGSIDTAMSRANKNCCMRLFIDGNCVGEGSNVYTPCSTYNEGISVILNEINPQDCLTLGGIFRRQGGTFGGIFKFTSNVEIAANATMDNFVTYYESNLNIQNTQMPSRYRPEELYGNSITIPFPPGVDKVKIRGYEYAAYAPAMFSVGKSGQKSLMDSIHGKTASEVIGDGDAPGVAVELLNAGNPVSSGTNDELARDPATGSAKLKYEVTLGALIPKDHDADAVSPVFDSITISYFLPREEVILFEKIVE